MALEAEIERLVVRLLGDAKDLEKVLNQAERAAETATKNIGSVLDGIGSALLTVGATFTTVFGGIAAFSLRQAASFESTTIAFETMLGSAEKARDLLADLTTFAVVTPYEMPAILQATRGLVQFGERGDELMETLEILGNAASGTSTDFGLLALIFNQIRGVGKLLTQDFRQLSTRGVISLQDIADHFGVATDEAQKMLSEGKISFEDVRNILKAMSEEGGRFANMMEKQSESLGGLWSTLSDNINIAKRVLGQGLAPAAKTVVRWLIRMTESLANINPSLASVAGLIVGLGGGLGVVTTALGGFVLIGPKFIAVFKAAGVAAAVLTSTTGLLTIGIGGLVAIIGVAVIKGWQYITMQKEMSAAKEKELELEGRLAAIQAERQSKVLSRASQFGSVRDRGAFLLREIERAKKEADGIKKLMDVQREAAERALGGRRRVGGGGIYDFEAVGRGYEGNKKRLKEAKRYVEELEKAYEDLILQERERARVQRETAEAQKKAMEVARLKQVKKELQGIYVTMRQVGMTSDQIQLDNLRMMGAGPEELAFAQRLLEITRARREQLKAIEDAKAEAERKAREAKLEAEREHQALISRAKSIIEANKTPIEKARDSIKELNMLARKGLIDPVTYRRAMNSIREDLKSLKDEAKVDLNFEYEGLEAGGFRSEMQIRKQIAFARNKQEEQKDLKKIEVHTRRMAAAMERRPIVVAPADLGGAT